MKLTDIIVDQTLRKDNRWKKKNPGDSSHLFLDDKAIDEIHLTLELILYLPTEKRCKSSIPYAEKRLQDKLSPWPSISFVYLRKNKLIITSGIECFKNVTHLYLEKNQISRMTSFNELQKLRKLYLGYNCISVVEGLEFCSNLELLHVQNQSLPPGGMLYFDPRCANGLQVSLKDLNVSGNNIIALTDFSRLDKLEKLDATDNKLENLSQIRDDLSELRRLKTLDLRGNPIKKTVRYREKIIAGLSSVDTLDDKPVTELTRVFIHNLEKCKKVERKSVIEFSKDIKSLAEHLPLGIRNSITETSGQEPKTIASTINVLLPKTPPVKINPMSSFPTRKKLAKTQSSSLQKDGSTRMSSKSGLSEDDNNLKDLFVR